MAVRRPKCVSGGSGLSRPSGSKKYRKTCPKCNGSGLFSTANVDVPCSLCGRKGYIELSYSSSQSTREAEKVCDYIVDSLEKQEEDSLFGYDPSSSNQTESLIKKNKLLSALYEKINE